MHFEQVPVEIVKKVAEPEVFKDKNQERPAPLARRPLKRTAGSRRRAARSLGSS
jgi:hypothetical protein